WEPLDPEHGVEPDERGALPVAGVTLRPRVAVEVPARERGRDRPAHRVPAADHLARADPAVRDPGSKHRVPVAQRLREPEVVLPGGSLGRDPAREAPPTDLLAA